MPPKYKIKRVEKADTRQVEEVKIEVIDLVSEESNREEPLDFQQEDEDMNEDDSEYNEDDDDDEDFEIEYRHKAPLTRRNLDNEAPPLAPEDLIENSTFVSVSRRNLNNYAVDSQRSRYYPMNYGVCRSGFNKSSYEAKIVNDAKFIVNDIPDEPMPVFFHAKSLNQLELVNELFTELEHVREMNNEKARGLLKRKTKSKTNIPIENFYFFIGSRQVKLVEPSSNNQNEEFKLSNGKQLDFSAAELYLYKSTFKYSTQSNRFWCFRNAIAVENVYPSYLDPTQQEYFIYSYFADKKLLLKLNDHSELLRSLLTLYTTHSIELIFKIDEEFNLNIDIYLNSVFKNDNLVADPSSYYLHKNYKNLNFVISSMFSLDHFVGYTTADYENELNSASNQKSIKNENLFDLVYKIHNDKRYELNEQQMAEIQCKSGLKSALRPYQLKAINWMLARERQNEQLFDDENDNIHPLYVQLTNKYNESIYYNKFDGVFSSIKPTTLKSLPGGILADEMGLGKTVEILALIQMNKRVDFPNTSNDLIFEQEPKRIKKAAFSCSCGNTPDYFRTDIYKNKVSLDLSSIYECVGCGVFSHFKCVNYNGKKSKFLCLHCCSKRKPIPSRATLIITPAVISHQWADEIKKHVKSSLKVLIYKGTQNGFIQPDDLAEYDVVIATYDALSSELSHVFAIENMRELRHSKRFMNIPSPLICVEWWRICLDEAQMVHSTNTRCAEMANRMFAVNRWCVSGTPIGKSLADLHGLFMFIREDPYYEKKWFYETLFAPYISGNKVPMTNAVARVLWRTSKHFVEDQINIPKQTEKIFWLDFSPFEAHLYERVLENFRLNRHGSFQNDVLFDEQFFQNCDKELVLDELDRKIIDKILSPILDLRLACNHPQLILRKKSFMAQNNGFRKEKILTIEKSIEMLLKKTQNECENALRLITMNKNALAGLNIISSDYAEAIQIYQSILHSEKVYESNVRLDKVQKVHTCFNYLSILRMTASEDKEKIEWLTNELSACEKAYMVSFDEAKQKNQEKLTEKSNEIKKHLSKVSRFGCFVYFFFFNQDFL
jgi:SNF2 family DNA or RNA helicase